MRSRPFISHSCRSALPKLLERLRPPTSSSELLDRLPPSGRCSPPPPASPSSSLLAVLLPDALDRRAPPRLRRSPSLLRPLSSPWLLLRGEGPEPPLDRLGALASLPRPAAREWDPYDPSLSSPEVWSESHEALSKLSS